MVSRKIIDNFLSQFEKDFSTHDRIEVSRSAIQHNLKLFEKISDLPAIPVLKGNAYGHGIAIVAKVLKHSNLPYIAVDGYFEALRIREVSNQPVLIMGSIKPENYPRLKYDTFTFVVQDKVSIHALGRTGRHIKVHLECNTGMNRHGASPDEVEELVGDILRYKNLELEGIMSHLADSDGDDPATVEAAVELFDRCVKTVLLTGANPTIFHIAQSAGSLKAKSAYANAFRLGIGLYGLNPFPSRHALHDQLKDLRPALRFVSTITKVIELKKGEHVSYNYTFTAPKDMKIGVMPVGYYEGLNRALSNTGVVKIGDTYCKITGRICMNHTMIDVDDTNARVGDEVIIYSDKPSDLNAIDSIAEKHNLFNYNLLTALTADVRRTIRD